jgi:hypothetical protein
MVSSMAEPSWRAIAYLLAGRLENNEFCDDHTLIETGLAVGCPFCRDREAMRVFRAKSGERRPVVQGDLIPVHEIRVDTSSTGEEQR